MLKTACKLAGCQRFYQLLQNYETNSVMFAMSTERVLNTCGGRAHNSDFFFQVFQLLAPSIIQ